MFRVIGLCVAIALLPAVSGAQVAAASDAKAIARRYFDEILNKRSAAAIDAIVSPDVVFRWTH